MDHLLTETTVGSYLVGRGVLPPGAVRARTLSGGVSNRVLLVESQGARVVLKQALPRLMVSDHWTADPARAQGEAVALRLLHGLTPESVPRVLDDDPERHTVTISAAPDSWVTWKDHLLAGRVNGADTAVAGWLGDVLRRWHTATQSVQLPPPLETTQVFRQLRVDPFLGTAAGRRPDLASHLDRHAEAMGERRRCLVSGDYSPKNVLVGQAEGWIIDLEVAHRGDPTFDVAFLMTHLLLKAVHRPDQREPIRSCLLRFLDAYGARLGAAEPAHLHGLVGCLLLARVVGSSPAKYLRPGEAEQVERAAAALVSGPPTAVDEVWTTVVAG